MNSAAERIQAFLDAKPTTGSVYVMKEYTVNQLRVDLIEPVAAALCGPLRAAIKALHTLIENDRKTSQEIEWLAQSHEWQEISRLYGEWM